MPASGDIPTWFTAVSEEQRALRTMYASQHTFPCSQVHKQGEVCRGACRVLSVSEQGKPCLTCQRQKYRLCGAAGRATRALGTMSRGGGGGPTASGCRHLAGRWHRCLLARGGHPSPADTHASKAHSVQKILWQRKRAREVTGGGTDGGSGEDGEAGESDEQGDNCDRLGVELPSSICELLSLL